MAVSSANRTGHPASRTVVEAASQLGPSVEFYLDGGPVAGGLASTIVDCTRDEPVVLRVGALAESEVMAVVERARAEAVEFDAAGSPHAEPDGLDPVEALGPPASTDPGASSPSEQRETTDDD